MTVLMARALTRVGTMGDVTFDIVEREGGMSFLPGQLFVATALYHPSVCMVGRYVRGDAETITLDLFAHSYEAGVHGAWIITPTWSGPCT